MLTLTLALALVAPNAGPLPSTAPPSTAQVRAAVERAVPYLEKEGVAWLDQRKCIACHHGAWMVWGLSEARRAGVSVDSKKLDALSARVATMYLAERAQHEQKKTGYVEGTYLLLSQYGGTEKVAEARQLAVDLIRRGQGANGSWKYQGQGLHRPEIEADEATTLWAILALDSKDETSRPQRERALGWLKKTAQGGGNESAALRLVLEQRFGEATRARFLKENLLARQNADGGWSWARTRGSDPFATGESLYALSLVGEKKDAPAMLAGRRFLLATQKADGSWFAPTKKPKGSNDISSYWGTAWAVIGLARSLPSE